MNVSLYIAKRYLRSKSSNNGINIISYIALTGVVLGAASLFIVLSGFAGLKTFTLQFSSVVDPDLKAETAIGKSFELTPEDLVKLDTIEEIAHYATIVEERVLIASENKTTLAIMKGVDANYPKVVRTDSILEYGNWLDQKSNQMVAGWGLSNSLSLGVLDFSKPISIYVPKPGKGLVNTSDKAFNLVKAINVGVFYINESLNDTYTYVPIALAKRLLNYKSNHVSSIEFKLQQGADEATAKRRIQNVFDQRVLIKNRAQLNDALYKMLNTENLAVYLIFTLVLIIAFFNVVGSLVMMILEKKKSLSTLYNMGVSLKDIRNIFFFQGSLMSVIGGLVGLIIGYVILITQKYFDLVMITETLAYPVNIKISNFFIVLITISILGFIASKIASMRISKSMIQGD